MKVLFLTAWYPHRKDDMEGLFVRKHAMAVAAHHQVDVIFLKSEDDLRLPKGKAFEKETSRVQNVRETYYYYPKARHIFGKLWRFFHLYRLAFNAYKAENGKPDIIHVSVLTRHGFVARLLQLRYGIPYVVTEHWSRYYQKPFRNALHKVLTRSVAKHASCLMPVSENLAESMRACGLRGHYKIVPNVVDDFFFQDITPPTISGIKTIIHICCFDEASKNNFGLLRTIKKLSEIRSDFRLIMVGDGKDRAATQEYARHCNLSEKIVLFTGKLPPSEVKQAFSKSDFMVLFSHYETQSVVICESLACGKPVVATHVGGIPELIDENNGLTVPVQDEDALYHALNLMLDTYQTYNSAEISRKAEEFSFARVGEKFSQIYQSALSK